MEKQEKKLDYTKYVFRQETQLDISPVLLDHLHKVLNQIISTDGVGTRMLTEPRFEYLHKVTSMPAKKGTKKVKLDAEYVRTFNVENTLKSPSTQYITELGKSALALMREIDQVRISGIDAGKGVLRSIVEKEMQEQREALMKEQVANLPTRKLT